MDLNVCHGSEFFIKSMKLSSNSFFPSLLTIKNCHFVFVLLLAVDCYERVRVREGGEKKREKEKERGKCVSETYPHCSSN